MEQYLVIIEQGEHNFSAYSPDILGCVATGDTIEETLERMRDALYWHLEDLAEQGEPLSKAQGIAAQLAEITPEVGDLFGFIQIDVHDMAKV